MAHKTSKQIDKHLEETYRFRWECLRRRPEFISDVKNFLVFFKKNPTKGIELEHDFFEKYGIFPPFVDDLSNPDRWDIVDSGYDIVAVVPDRPWYIAMPGKSYKVKERNWQNLLKKEKVEFYKHILKNNRFLTLRIDIDRDKTIIERAISKKLTWIIEKKKQFGLGGRLDKTLNLDKSERYFKVYDLRNEKPPVKYEKIALLLLNEKYYNGGEKDNLGQIVNLAKKDYATIFEEIHGIPYKWYDKSKLKKSDFKGCKQCPKTSVCKELCADMEYLLSQEEVKQRHRIG